MKNIKLKIANDIPSTKLKQYLIYNSTNLSVMQWATIASENTQRTKLAEVFQKLSKLTHDAYEQKLLLAAVSDLQKDGYIGEHAQAVFDEKRQENLPPYFPFLEICRLPILFQRGDVIVDKCTGDIACVESAPLLNSYSDFTDECYYCHSLDCKITEHALRDGNAHLHIHVCDADSCDINTLSAEQFENWKNVKELLDISQNSP